MKISESILKVLAPKTFGAVLPIESLKDQSFKLFDVIKQDDIDLTSINEVFSAEEVKALRKTRLVFSNSKGELVIFPISSYLNFKVGTEKNNTLILSHLNGDIKDFKVTNVKASSYYPISSYLKYDELIEKYFTETPDGDFVKFYKLNPSLSSICKADGRLKENAEPYKQLIVKLL